MPLALADLRGVAVIGAGTMGHGIAQLAAQAGYEVRLYDVSLELAQRGLGKVKEQLDRAVAKGKVTADARDAALARLRPIARLDDAEGCQLVIEAAPENLELKRRILGELAERLGPEA